MDPTTYDELERLPEPALWGLIAAEVRAADELEERAAEAARSAEGQDTGSAVSEAPRPLHGHAFSRDGDFGAFGA